LQPFRRDPHPSIDNASTKTASAVGEFRHRIAKSVYKAANSARGKCSSENNP
jgi:hypothetical protein